MKAGSRERTLKNIFDIPDGSMTKSSCLITGGSGFIGTHLINHFLKERCFSKIIVLDLVPSNVADPSVEYVFCDIRKPIPSEGLPPCDICFHLAALCKEPGYDWNDYFVTNHEGTGNVIRLADEMSIRTIIFTSTMMVFRAGDERNAEDDTAAPDTAYGISKLLAELELKRWEAGSAENRLRIVRPGVVFGKGESANYTRLYYALKKRRFAYIGRKTTVKGSIYVKDLVRFLDFCRSDTCGHTLYNLAYPDPLTIEQICRAMYDVFGLKGVIPVVPYRPALMLGYFFEYLALLGTRTGIHHRRIQKLYYSTDITADRAAASGFLLSYPLREALLDWRQDCLPEDLY